MWWWEQIPQRELGPIRGPMPAIVQPPQLYRAGTLRVPSPPTYTRPPRVFTVSEIEANRAAGGSGVPAGAGGDAGGRGDFGGILRDQQQQAQQTGVSNGNGTTNGIGAAVARGGLRAAISLGSKLLGPAGAIVGGLLNLALGRGVFGTVNTPSPVVAPDAPLTIPDGFVFSDPFTGVPSAIPDVVTGSVLAPDAVTTPDVISDAPSPIDAVKAPDSAGITTADISEEMNVDVQGPGSPGTGMVGQDITGGESFGGQAGASGAQVGAESAGADPSAAGAAAGDGSNESNV